MNLSVSSSNHLYKHSDNLLVGWVFEYISNNGAEGEINYTIN